ncbi:MAG: hypothetical protein GY756_01845, partial [bacterium]|nr:hypothetical protein [bacterium]
MALKYIILLFFGLTGFLFADNSKLAQSIDTLIDKNLPNAFVGVIVKD